MIQGRAGQGEVGRRASQWSFHAQDYGLSLNTGKCQLRGVERRHFIFIRAHRQRGKLHDHMYVCSEHTKAEPSRAREKEQNQRTEEEDG